MPWGDPLPQRNFREHIQRRHRFLTYSWIMMLMKRYLMNQVLQAAHRPKAESVLAVCLHVPELPFILIHESYDSVPSPVQRSWNEPWHWDRVSDREIGPRSALLSLWASFQKLFPLLLTSFASWLSLCWFSATSGASAALWKNLAFHLLVFTHYPPIQFVSGPVSQDLLSWIAQWSKRLPSLSPRCADFGSRAPDQSWSFRMGCGLPEAGLPFRVHAPVLLGFAPSDAGCFWLVIPNIIHEFWFSLNACMVPFRTRYNHIFWWKCSWVRKLSLFIHKWRSQMKRSGGQSFLVRFTNQWR